MSPGTLLIRADANAAIGTGHVMRCLALAQGWQDAGGDALFAAAEMPDAVEKRLRGEQIEVVRLRAAAGTEQDAAELGSLAVARRSPWVVLDGERFKPPYFQRLKAFEPKILWLDDFGSTTSHAADLILNQNLGATRELYPWFPDDNRLLVGTKYITLRREFRNAMHVGDTAQEARNLLVTFGGSDPDNLTGKVLQAVAAHLVGMQVTAVVGAGNPRMTALRSLALSLGVTLVTDPPDMPALMAESDLAVIAAGGTLWELLYCGCAVLSYSRNSVQASVIAELAEAGVVGNLGSVAAFSPAELRARIGRVADSVAEREEMRTAGRRIVDGDGVARVLRAMNGE